MMKKQQFFYWPLNDTQYSLSSKYNTKMATNRIKQNRLYIFIVFGLTLIIFLKISTTF